MIRRIEAITHYAVLDHNRKRQAQAKLEIQSLENKIKKDIRSKQQEIYNLYRRIIDIFLDIASLMICAASVLLF